MRPVTVSVGPLTAAVANGIVQSQSLGAAGPLTLNGSYVTNGVATLPQPRRVIIASAGNDSAVNFTITGTNWTGGVISEVLAGTNIGTAQSVLDYATVTSIVGSAATASTVTAGANGVASSPWVRLDEWSAAPMGAQFSAVGVVSYTLQTSFDDPNDPLSGVTPATMTWDSASTAIVNQTTTQTTNLLASPRWARVLLNSGTGSVTATMTQYQPTGR